MKTRPALLCLSTHMQLRRPPASAKVGSQLLVTFMETGVRTALELCCTEHKRHGCLHGECNIICLPSYYVVHVTY